MPIENPWRHFTTEETDFVLEMDREAVEAYSQRRKVQNNPDYKLHTYLPPTPFLGDPSAPVVLLSRNPSFHPQDLSDYESPEFRETAIRNLTHSNADRPFFPLDRAFADTASYLRYWRDILGELVAGASRVAVASHVACFQAFPYHAGKYDYDLTLPSQPYTTHLVTQAVEQGAFVVGLQGQSYWERVVPELVGAENVRWVSSRRSAIISRKNIGPKHYVGVLEALRSA